MPKRKLSNYFRLNLRSWTLLICLLLMLPLLLFAMHRLERIHRTHSAYALVMQQAAELAPSLPSPLASAQPQAISKRNTGLAAQGFKPERSGPDAQLYSDYLGLTAIWLGISFLFSQMLAAYILRQLARITAMMKSNFDLSKLVLRVDEFWQLTQTAAQDQRHERALEIDLIDTSRERNEIHALYDLAPCGYYSLNMEGQILRINQTQSNWLGYQVDEMLGRRSRDFLTPSGKSAFLQDLPLLLARNKISNRELDFVCKDGSEMPALISAEAVFDEAGEFLLIRVVVFNNTERKRTQQSLAQAHARELETGREIQRRLLSTPALPAHAGLWLSTFSKASNGVDGDFLDVIVMGDHWLDIVAGDVMGKGVPAALMGAAIKLQFSRSNSELLTQRGSGAEPPQPAEIVTAVNRAMAPQLQALDAFATLVYLRLDTLANSLTWVGCGHEEALHISASGAVQRLANQHPPLGLLAEETFVQNSCDLATGDAVFLCSDGAADAMLANGQRLGREPVVASAIAKLLTHRTPAMTLHTMRRDLLPAGTTLSDDLTMLVLMRHPLHPASAHLELPPSLASLRQLREFVTCQALRCGLGEIGASLLSVAAVELLSNVARHGQGLLEEAPIELITEPTADGLLLEFNYLGEYFPCPETLPANDFSAFPESGFGLHIIRSVPNELEHQFEDGVNRVRLLMRSNALPRD